MMKKFLSVLLVFTFLLSLVSCGSSLETQTGTGENPTQENTQKETGEITLPKGFSAGFARVSITPTLPVKMGTSKTANVVLDDLYASCVAVSDGENVALFFHMDTKDMPEKIYSTCAGKIEKSLGVPAANITMTATHTHTSPHTDNQDPSCVQWHKLLYTAVPQAAEEAMRDLAPAEVYTGTGTAQDFAFVRRYLMADGSYKGIQTTNPCNDYVAHETEADPELRTIHFKRDGEKDIVMVNWQAHAAGAANIHSTSITSDFIHYLRKGVEEEMDVHFAYYNGGSGNIGGVNSKMGRDKFKDYAEMGTALVNVVKEAVKGEKKAQSGTIRAQASRLSCNVRQDSEEQRAQAREWANAEDKDKDSILAKYGFRSQYEAIAINTRAKMDPVTEVPLSVVTFGDIAITVNPFEYFDTNAKEIRDASPYAMTFTCGYSNGALGYMPPDEIFPHGEYEVYVARFEAGTAEICAEEILRMLAECKAAS